MSALDRSPAEALRELVAEVSGRPAEAATADSSVWDLGLDSLRQMILVARLKAAGYSADFAEMSSAVTFGEWCRLIRHAPSDMPGDTAVGESGERSTEDTDGTCIPFTPMQTAYWLGRDPDLPLGGKAAQYYVEFDRSPQSAAIDGPQFVERLRAAVHKLGDRHALVRSRVVTPDRLEIGPQAGWMPAIGVFDERALTPGEVAATLRRRRADWARRVLNVRAGEMIAVAVSLLPANRLRVHLAIDMLIADGESFGTLLRELSLLVREPAADLGAVPPPFRQAVDWCRRQPTAVDRRFWLETIEKLPMPPPLLSGALDADAAAEPIRRHVWIEPRRREQLEQLAAGHRTTVSAVVATVYAEVVARWSGVRQFSLNIPISLRSDVRERCAGTVGDFTDFGLVAVDLTSGEFVDRCRALHRGILAALNHRGVSGPEQLRMLSRREGQPVTAPVVFTSMLGMGELYSEQVRGALGEPVWTSSQIPQVLLDCQVLDDRDGFTVNWDAASGTIADPVFDAMFEAFVAALQGLTDDAFTVAVAVPAEQLTARRDRLSKVQRDDRPLFADYLKQASARPTATAVVCGSEQISYGELRVRSVRLAGTLTTLTGSADPVAVCLPKGIDQIVAVLGVAMSGSAYVPISPGQPAQRRDEMLRASGARIAIVPDGADGGLPGAAWPAAVGPLSVQDLLDRPAPSVELGAVDAGAPAYIIFTSGSTGPPKGVMMSHRAAVNTLDDVRHRFGLDECDRVLGFSQLDFDLSVYDIFATLGAGGILVLPGESAQLEPAELRALCARHEVTVWNSVPTLFDMVLTAGRDAVWPSLRLVLLSGDWIATALPERIRGSGVRIIGMGGATEAGIWSNYFDATASDLSGWMSVPYGAPLRNQEFRVIGPDGADCPDWAIGELLIGGDSLADGYLADPELTARKFVVHGQDRWYHTGDFGRYRSGGLLEFLGRRDQQVKVGGFRVELGEIEAACRRTGGVAQAVAVVAGQRKHSIVVFVTVIDGAPDPAELLAAVRNQVPAYMVPRRIVVLGELPRTPNDKVDRAALARLGTTVLRGDRSSAGSGAGGVGDSVSALVEQAWHEVSGQRGGMDENFFRLGGDSLTALRLLDVLERRGLTGGRLRRLVESATMADFAATLSPGSGAAPVVRPELRPDAEVPLTQVQRAYLSGERPGSWLGGIPALSYWEFSSARHIDADRLGRAVEAVVRRHPMLRGALTETGFRIGPQDRDPYPAVVVVTDADGFREWRDAARQVPSGETRPPLKLAVFPAVGGDRVGLVLDHLYFDAVSAMTVMNDLGDAYSGSTDEGEQPRPVAVPARVRPGDRAFWESRLGGIPPAPVLPTAVSPAAVDRPRFVRRSARLREAEWRRVQEAAARLGSSVTGILLTAFTRCVLVNSRDRAGTVVVTTFDSTGPQPGDRETVGDRTELLLVPCDAVGNNFASDLAGMTAGLADALDHRTMSGLAVMAELSLRDRALGPAVVFTSAVGLPRRREPLQQSFGTYASGVSQTPQTLLDCQVLESGDGLLISFDHVEQLLPAEYVDGLIKSMLSQLHDLIEGRDPGPPATVPVPRGAAHHAVPRYETSGVVAEGLPHSSANDETRALVLELWSRMLGQPVTATDDFFDIGGDSLVAARTVAAIRGQIGVEIALGEVVRCRTADRLAVLVGGRQAEADMVSGAV